MKSPSPKNKKQPRPAPLSSTAPAATAADFFTRAKPWLPWAALALLAVAVYIPAMFAVYVWDDDALTANPWLRSAGGLFKIWTDPAQIPRETHYWPLVYTTFWLESRIWGFYPYGYHVVNILLHAATTVLFWRVLVKLEAPGAWLAAALFAVHPVHAESVAWVIERKDVLSGALFFASALAFLKCGMRNAEPTTPNSPLPTHNSQLTTHNSPLTTHNSQLTTYYLCLFLFLAALLSKSVVIGLPLALALVLWWRGRLTWRTAAALAPLAALAAVMTVIDMRLWGGHEFIEPAAPWPARLLQVSRAAWTYLIKLALPYPLATFYPRWDIRPANPLAWVPLAAGVALFVGLWAARRRIGRGPLAAMLYYSVLLGPTLGLVHYDFLHLSWVADRFQYLASAGPLALAAAALTRLSERRRWRPETLAWVSRALVAILAILCLAQASIYKDSLKLFAHNVRVYPESWAAHYMHGWALMEAGRNEEAVNELGEAATRMPVPDYMVHFFMAQAQQRLGNYAQSDASFRECLKINPQFASGWNNYGVMLAEAGRPEDAIKQYDRALEVRSDYAEALSNKGNALKRLKRMDEAERTLRQAIKLESGRAEFHNNLGMVMVESQRYEEALPEFETAVKLNPRLPAARNNLGMALAQKGDLSRAAEQFEAALQLTPQAPYLHFQLGEIYRAMNRKQDAARCYQQALRLDPNYPEPAARLKELHP